MSDRTLNDVELICNPQWEAILKRMQESTDNIMVTGRAGTGKSTLLDYFRHHTTKNVVVLAPTGIAALNVQGETIHRFFHFYIDVTPEKIRQRKVKPFYRRLPLYKRLQTLVIDEISMVRADLFDCMDVFLRMYGSKRDKPFGGVQVILVGDLYQLPPVVLPEEADIFSEYYTTPYFFSAQAFLPKNGFDVTVMQLTQVYRQVERGFIDILNRVRDNALTPVDVEQLNQRYIAGFEPSQEARYITLTTTNACANAINLRYLRQLPTRCYTAQAVIQGGLSEDNYPAPMALQFKIGSQIMLLTNDSEQRWVNGTLGVIESFKTIENKQVIYVRLQGSNELVAVKRFTWEMHQFRLVKGAVVSELIGTFNQYPFRLAWAMTIHKSQGKTFERVLINLRGGTFAAGQLYVALSRCRSLEGIVLQQPLHQADVMTDEILSQLYRQLPQSAYSLSQATVLAGLTKEVELTLE